MKIGKIIQDLKCSDAEKERIRISIVDGDGLPSYVFEKYVAKIDDEKIWRVANKAYGVKGFRLNKHNPLVVDKIKDSLEKRLSRNDPIFLNLYFYCVISWLKKERPKLNNFLLTYPHDENKNSSVELMKSIAENRILYEFSRGDILDFHGVYWFERIGNLEFFISSYEINEESVSSLIKKRLISIENGLNNEDKKNIKKIMELSNRIENIENSISFNDPEKILNSKIDELKKSISIISGESDGYSYKLSEINEKIQEIENSINFIKEKINNSNDDETASSNETEAFSASLNCENIRQRLEGLFPLRGSFSELAISLISIIEKNNAIFFESQELFNIIFFESAAEGHVHEVVLEPALRSSHEVYNEKDNHKVLLLKNFSYALIEATVIPLISKANSAFVNSFPKIIVLDDQDANAYCKSKILSRSVFLSMDVINLWLDSYVIYQGRKAAKASFDDISISGCELLKIVKNHGINILNESREKFNRILPILYESLPVNDCLAVCASMTILPYIELKYGETKHQIILEHIRDLIG